MSLQVLPLMANKRALRVLKLEKGEDKLMIRALVMMVLILAAALARADISDSGNLTIGGTGVIQGTMTVQGSAFGVGGATFTVAGGSVTLGGRLNVAAAGIKWADGTTSTTASSGGGAAGVRLSTFTMFGNTSATNVDVCVATVTFTPTVATVDVVFMGTINNGNTGDPCMVAFLIDGAHPAGWSRYTGLSMGTNGYNQDASFTYPNLAVTANTSHSVCLRGGCGGYTINFCGTSGSSYFTQCKFGMRESN